MGFVNTAVLCSLLNAPEWSSFDLFRQIFKTCGRWETSARVCCSQIWDSELQAAGIWLELKNVQQIYATYTVGHVELRMQAPW